MFALLDHRTLTSLRENVTINPIEGDSESVVQIPPHLNSGLWSVYLEEYESMRETQPPTDGSQEAPGGTTPNPPTDE